MKLLSDYFVTISSTIAEAIAVIDRGAAKIALVVESGRLIGTVTDGDIRRALLRNESIDKPVEKIMCKNFRYLLASSGEDEALALMRREVLHQIPVLDERGNVVNLFLLEDLIRPKNLPNPVVIMAGGEGRRLYPLTHNCPKPMLRIAGKPLLEIILLQCIDAGFRDFYFSVNYLKDQIKDYFLNGERWGVHIQYLEEVKPLGTAGALSLIPKKHEKPILVMNGDILSRANYTQLLHFHENYSASGTLCVREFNTQIPYGVIRMNDIGVVALEEKPIFMHHVNAGIYLLNPELLDLVPNNTFFDMPELLKLAIQQGFKINAFPIHEYWLDIGKPETLARAHGEWQ